MFTSVPTVSTLRILIPLSKPTDENAKPYLKLTSDKCYKAKDIIIDIFKKN